MIRIKKSSIKLNFLYNSLYQVLLIVLPLVTSPYISRTLGSEGVGEYSYTFSIASSFALLGMLGVINYGNRTIASVQDDRFERSRAFWSIWKLQVFVTAVVLLIYLLYILYVCPEKYKLLSYVQAISILSSMVDINWFFFGMEKFRLTVIRNVFIKIINVFLIFIFVKTADDVWLYTLIMASGMLLSNLLIWPFLRREVDYMKSGISYTFSHLRQMLILFIPVIAVTLYKRIDKVMLGALSTMSQTGFFENTEKIINIPMGVITALGTVMLPRMSYLFAKGKADESKKYIEYSMEFISFMSAAMIFGIAGIAKEFAPLFFGQAFTEVGTLIIAISPTIFFVSFANVIRTQYLIPLRYDKVYIISVWAGAIANLMINIALIPKMGAFGAVLGTVFAEMSVMIYQTWYVRKELPVKRYLLKSIYYIIAGIVMFFVIRFVSKFGSADFSTILLEIFIGALVYIVLCAPYMYIMHKSKINLYIKAKKNKM